MNCLKKHQAVVFFLYIYNNKNVIIATLIVQDKKNAEANLKEELCHNYPFLCIYMFLVPAKKSIVYIIKLYKNNSDSEILGLVEKF